MGALRADEQKPLDAPIIISDDKALDAPTQPTRYADPETAYRPNLMPTLN